MILTMSLSLSPEPRPHLLSIVPPPLRMLHNNDSFFNKPGNLIRASHDDPVWSCNDIYLRPQEPVFKLF